MEANGNQEPRQQPQPQGSPVGGGGFTLPGKMLGIAGGGAAAAALVVVIVVIVLLVTGVFGGGGGGGASGGSDILAYVPGDAGVVGIMDLQAVLNGGVPEDLIEYWEDDEDESGGGFSDFPESYDDLDVDDDDIATFAFVTDEDQNDSLVIVQGDFEFDLIREDLEDGSDCEDDDYRGFELWECPDGGAVALFEKDGYLVFAAEQRQDDLEDLLTLKSRDPEKLADGEDSDLKRILDQAGNGWMRFALISDDCVVIDRCEGIAIAIGERDDSDSMPASYAVMFSSERAAAAEGDVAIDESVEELFTNFNLELDIGDVKADGEFVVGTGVAEFVHPDDASSRSSNLSGGGQRGSAAPGAASPPAAAQVRATATPLPNNAPVGPTPTAVIQAAPAAPYYAVGGSAETNAPALALPRGDWLDDCAGVTLEQTNQFLARHEQIGYGEAFGHCECLYDYFEMWEGPPTFTVGDLLAGPTSNDALTLAELYRDASSYCG